MALILANDGITAKAKAELVELGHEVDEQKYTGDALLARLPEVDCIVVRSATKLRRPELDAGANGRLKLIIRGGVGLDNIDVTYAAEKGIEVRNTPSASSNAVAELTLGQMIVMARHIGEANLSMRQGKWMKKEYSGIELSGKTLGLIGFGRIARLLAAKCIALGMKIEFTDILDIPSTTCEQVTLNRVLEDSDFISIHIPFAGGKPVIGEDEISRMKDGVYILNCARGGVLDEDALVDAIQRGKVAGAALDVFNEEPFHNERIAACEKISITPHIGAATKEAQERIGDVIVEIIKESL